MYVFVESHTNLGEFYRKYKYLQCQKVCCHHRRFNAINVFLSFKDSNVMGKTARSKLCWSFILSYVHNFAYLNVDDQSGTKLKMSIYCIEILILPVERIFLLNEAKDQQTLNNDNTSDTLLTSPI